MKKALIIDDTKNIRMMLSQFLELEGYEIETAGAGPEGYEILQNHTFDLVFLDIKLPEISGTELLRRVKAAGNRSNFIIMTAYPTIKNAVECTQLGAKAYMQKPFTTTRLKALLEDLTLTNSDPTVDSARILMERGKCEEAISALKALLPEDHDNPEIYALISKAYELIGENELSEKFGKTAELFTQLY